MMTMMHESGRFVEIRIFRTILMFFTSRIKTIRLFKMIFELAKVLHFTYILPHDV